MSIAIEICIRRNNYNFMIDYLNRFYLFCKEEPLWVVAFAFCGFINLTAYLTL
jgi:hypothetical protein